MKEQASISAERLLYFKKRLRYISVYLSVETSSTSTPLPCPSHFCFKTFFSAILREDLKWQCTGLPASFQLNALLVGHRQSVQTGRAFRVSTLVLGSESHRQASSLWPVTSNYRLFQSCGPLIIFFFFSLLPILFGLKSYTGFSRPYDF